MGMYQPQINEYRNKDEFNFRPGIDGNPKTLGFFVSNPTKENIYCVSAMKLINMRQSHKDIAQVSYIFVLTTSTGCIYISFLILRFLKLMLENLICPLVMIIWMVAFGEESLCVAI